MGLEAVPSTLPSPTKPRKCCVDKIVRKLFENKAEAKA